MSVLFLSRYLNYTYFSLSPLFCFVGCFSTNTHRQTQTHSLTPFSLLNGKSFRKLKPMRLSTKIPNHYRPLFGLNERLLFFFVCTHFKWNDGFWLGWNKEAGAQVELWIRKQYRHVFYARMRPATKTDSFFSFWSISNKANAWLAKFYKKVFVG